MVKVEFKSSGFLKLTADYPKKSFQEIIWQKYIYIFSIFYPRELLIWWIFFFRRCNINFTLCLYFSKNIKAIRILWKKYSVCIWIGFWAHETFVQQSFFGIAIPIPEQFLKHFEETNGDANSNIVTSTFSKIKNRCYNYSCKYCNKLGSGEFLLSVDPYDYIIFRKSFQLENNFQDIHHWVSIIHDEIILKIWEFLDCSLWQILQTCLKNSKMFSYATEV